jgi:putative hemolysin
VISCSQPKYTLILKTSSDGDPDTALLHFMWPTILLVGNPMAWGLTTIYLVLLLILLALTAIVAGSEVAFFSLDAKQINHLKINNKGVNRTIVHLLERPQKLLATILIANSFLSIGIIITTNLLLNQLIAFDTLFVGNILLQNFVKVFVQVVLVTFLLVLFGEVMPKVYAMQNNMRMSTICAPIINVLQVALGPVSGLLARSSALLEKNINNKRNNISDEDVEHAIEIAVGNASLEEKNIYKGIVRLRSTTVKQIMKSRLDISAIPSNLAFSDVQSSALEIGYSRIPVYDQSLDQIKGILHTKDLLAYTDQGIADWQGLVKAPIFVPENKLCNDLLKEFQRKRLHMAIVVDEFGGTSGLVTLEDVMEEVVGDIRDEFDEDDAEIKQISDNTFLCEGKASINDLGRSMNINPDEFEIMRGESDTVAGLVLEILGKFPQLNQRVQHQRFVFTVTELEKMRIKRVKVELLPHELHTALH